MSHKLLLADDSLTIQRVIELTFSGEDVQVLSVSDGEQAISDSTSGTDLEAFDALALERLHGVAPDFCNLHGVSISAKRPKWSEAKAPVRARSHTTHANATRPAPLVLSLRQPLKM